MLLKCGLNLPRVKTNLTYGLCNMVFVNATMNLEIAANLLSN
jgi:hypothetical protein